MKQLLIALPLSMLVSMMPASAQTTTQSFKPDASMGEDAIISELTGGCIPSGTSVTPANMNFGNDPSVYIKAWTWTDIGCTTGQQRMLIRFNGLSSIPTSADIVSATLILQTPQTMPNDPNFAGNSYYTGSGFPTNPGWLKRIVPGTGPSTYWDEQNITWNQFQTNFSTDPNSANWVTIPSSTGQYNTTTTLNVTAIVQQIINELATNAYANNGFQLELQTEINYRAQYWASSDYPDSTFWPELIVTYKNCNPSFTYCVNSNSPYTFDFTANNPNQSYYNWAIDGTTAGNTSTISYTFPGPGSYEVCLETGAEDEGCKYCMRLCVEENESSQRPALIPEQPQQLKSVPQGISLPGDDIQTTSDRDGSIVPNPTNTGWNVKFNAPESGKVSVNIVDPTGRTISTMEKKVLQGEQLIYQDAAKLAPGIYFIEIKGAGVQFRRKAVRN